MIPVPALRALLSLLVAWSLLLPPRVAFAQEPTTTSDRDLDGVVDNSDVCPDTYGAPPSGCPPQTPPPSTTVTPEPTPDPVPPPRTDRDADGLYDDEDACPDAPSASTNGCPEGQGPVVTTPTTEPAPEPVAEPVDPSDEYQQLLRTLPKDFDLNYRYDAPARKRQRDRDPGLAAKQIRALGISGGVLMLAGTVGIVTTLSVGLARAGDAKSTLEQQREDMTSGMPVDFDEREEALKKGEQGDKIAIIGGATSGAVFALGGALLIGARSLRRKTYGGGGGGGSGGGLSDKSRRNLTLYGALLLVYGAASLIGGGVLYGKDDAKKKKNGKILLGLGGTMAGIGVLMFIPVVISRAKRTAQIQTGPMWVRSGGGAGVRVRF